MSFKQSMNCRHLGSFNELGRHAYSGSSSILHSSHKMISVKEVMTYLSKVVSERTFDGQRQCVEQENTGNNPMIFAEDIPIFTRLYIYI
jgi:hypothetical protein